METRVLLGPAFMENVGKEIKTAADGTLTIGDMTKVVKAVGDAEKNEKLTHTKAITDLAQSLVEVSSRPMAGARPISPKQMELGKLATGISNMSVATVLSFGDLVNLKLAGKLMRGVEVGVWETFKSYLSTALVKLGFGVEAATKIEKAKTPDDTKKVLAEVAKNNPGSAEVVGKLDKAGTNTDVVQVMAEAPTPAAVTTPPPVEDISGLAGAADIPGAVYNSKLAQALMPITAGTGYKQRIGRHRESSISHELAR
jgi:hypothetical protein